MAQNALAPAFADPPQESQAVFRAAMEAMARPGRLLSCRPALVPPAPLSPVAAALALTLCDFETTLWLDPPLAAQPAVAGFLTFHTGARLVSEPALAQFALVADPSALPSFAAFAQGSPEFPDRSTTLILQVRGFDEAFRFEGPGIDGRIGFGPVPCPDGFADGLGANRALFPQGVDLIFAGPDAVAALPRSVHLVEG